MDALSEALRGMQLTGALIFNAELTAPWGVRTPPASAAQGRLAPGTEHLVLFHLVVEGTARARVGTHEVSLEAGDIVVFPHGDGHELWNGRVHRLDDGAALLPKILSGSLEVERGGGGGALTKFVCGYFGCERYARQLFLAGLPPVFKVHVRGDASGAWIESSLRHVVAEAASGRAGRSALVSRLAEALFLQTLCRWTDSLGPRETGWLAAARDEVVGRTLAAIHREPARAWTVDSLAKEGGASRTVLSGRFARLVGEGPLAYVTRLRLQLAERALRKSTSAVIEVAIGAGYESEAAFNRAFKREFGLPPARYRQAMRQSVS